MSEFKIFAFNIIAILSAVCVRTAILEGNEVGVFTASVLPTSEELDEQKDTKAKDVENFLDNITEVATADLNITGLNSGEESLESEINCAGGGLFDFIQCVIRSKIKSFSLESSKALIPDKPPKGFKPKTMESKVNGSLEDWIRKHAKHINSVKGDCKSDE